MLNYHYLLNALPEVSAVTHEQLNDVLMIIEDSLDEPARKAFHFLLHKNDNKNLLNLLRKRDGILPRSADMLYSPAVFAFEDLDDMLIDMYDGEMPAYMRQFLDEEKNSPREVWERENRLLELYYNAGLAYPHEFIKSLFGFKRDLKNVLLALNARLHNLNMPELTVGDYDLTATLASSTLENFGLAGEHLYIPELSNLLAANKLLDLEHMVDRLISDHCYQLTIRENFSLASVLYYYLQLDQQHRWQKLSKPKGEIALEELTQEIIKSAERPFMAGKSHE